jgi:hypothetical protein
MSCCADTFDYKVTDILFWMGDMDYHNGSTVKEARNALQGID